MAERGGAAANANDAIHGGPLGPRISIVVSVEYFSASHSLPTFVVICVICVIGVMGWAAAADAAANDV